MLCNANRGMKALLDDAQNADQLWPEVTCAASPSRGRWMMFRRIQVSISTACLNS